MATTYGQLRENNGEKLTLKEFHSEVAKRMKQYVFIKLTIRHEKLATKLYKQGYTIADTVGMLILNT